MKWRALPVVRWPWPNVQQTCATQISAWLVTSQKWPRWQTLEMRKCTPIAQMSSSGGVTARLPLWRKAYSGQLPTHRGRRRRAEADPDARGRRRIGVVALSCTATVHAFDYRFGYRGGSIACGCRYAGSPGWLR